MLRVGLIGFGYWGPNLARNFSANPDCQLVRIADKDPARQRQVQQLYKNCEVVSDTRLITKAKDVDIVVIATPVSTHYELAREALLNGKQVWIEKPVCASVEEANELVELQARKKATVMVDHTFLFTGAVLKIKELISKHELGDLYYYDSVRINLGLFQHDVNVIWDLATHDLSIMDFLLGPKAQAVSAVGSEHFDRKLADIGYLTVYYGKNLIAHFHVNWLSPVKIRRTIIGGGKKMLAWNDLDQEETIKIYDRGVDIKSKEGTYTVLPEYRIGQMYAPVIRRVEALSSEVSYFIECIKNKITPHNDLQAGIRVLKILEAADKSLRKKGSPIKLA